MKDIFFGQVRDGGSLNHKIPKRPMGQRCIYLHELTAWMSRWKLGSKLRISGL